ncbi:hypothetical protein [Natrinema soli]|uniref:Uncharacterized protein n=1 Tax=Natrinema soli TaxID=1930624 RepID=A0ABD5SFT8_9EURY
MYAHNTFDEEDWDRLIVVNEENVLEVTGGSKPQLEVATSE